MVRQIVYISSSPSRDEPKEIAAILAAARRNNAAEGITGLLAFVDGSFLQVLEGEAGAVSRRFEIIRRDARHSFVIKLLDRDVPERMFPDWSMAWRACPPDHPAAAEVRAIARRGEIAPATGDAALEALIASVFRSVPA